MSYLKNVFHLYETKEAFEKHLSENLIDPNSICFIKETQEIYTQGEYFGMSDEFKETIELFLELIVSAWGTPDGLAVLDSEGRVPVENLPSYVDDVLEYPSLSEFPTEGEKSKIYVALDTNLTYRWSGSTYIEISESLKLGETATTAYRGDLGRALSDRLRIHVTDTENPHNVTKEQVGLGNVDNTSDLSKPISNASKKEFSLIRKELEGKQDLIKRSEYDDLNRIKETMIPGEVAYATDQGLLYMKTKKEDLSIIANEDILLNYVTTNYFKNWTSNIYIPFTENIELSLSNKVDKVERKGLSTYDFSAIYKNILDNPWATTIE